VQVDSTEALERLRGIICGIGLDINELETLTDVETDLLHAAEKHEMRGVTVFVKTAIRLETRRC